MKKALISIVLAILLLGCASQYGQPNQSYNQTQGNQSTQPGNKSPGNMPPSSGGVVTVQISGFKFSPADIQVSAGTNVTWTNEDSVMHTVTFDNGMFNSPSIQHGDSVSYVFGKPGVYTYHCSVHPSMTGSVTVK
jgi:plastocyanin